MAIGVLYVVRDVVDLGGRVEKDSLLQSIAHPVVPFFEQLESQLLSLDLVPVPNCPQEGADPAIWPTLDELEKQEYFWPTEDELAIEVSWLS